MMPLIKTGMTIYYTTNELQCWSVDYFDDWGQQTYTKIDNKPFY